MHTDGEGPKKGWVGGEWGPKYRSVQGAGANKKKQKKPEYKMIRTTIPLSIFNEIEQRDRYVFFVRFDKTITEDMVECTEMGVMVDGVPTYAKLVAAIITGKYDYDTQIAMLANKDDGDPAHAEAWEEFQAWRTESKRLAHIIFPETNTEEEA